jgi:hypothetical protein
MENEKDELASSRHPALLRFNESIRPLNFQGEEIFSP